jgi:hypothetical protein
MATFSEFVLSLFSEKNMTLTVDQAVDLLFPSSAFEAKVKIAALGRAVPRVALTKVVAYEFARFYAAGMLAMTCDGRYSRVPSAGAQQ